MRHRRLRFMRNWAGVPLWPVPMTILAALWLAAAVASVGDHEPGTLERAGERAAEGKPSPASTPATRPAEGDAGPAGAAAHPWFDAALRTSHRLPMGDGTAASFARTDPDSGEPTSVGVTFDAAALASLPAGRDAEFVLPLPPGTDLAPFDHVAIHWQSRGHGPAGLYDVPHLDVRFFMLTPARRDRITATGPDGAACARALPGEHLPHGYVMLPGGTPRAGAHWVDPSAAESAGSPLTATFLYGSYDGQLAFLEAMVSLAFLESRATVVRNLKLPKRYAAPGYYPTTYRVSYDPGAAQYTVALEGLVRR